MLFRRLFSLLSLSLASAFAAPLAPLPRDAAILSYPALIPQPVDAPARVLLVSDSPETVRLPGLLYRDTVQGAARVLAYHVNALPGPQPARLLIVATNPGLQEATLTLTRLGGASTRQPDPLIGQQTLLRYFASGPLAPRRLPAGGSRTLYDSGPLTEGQVVSVMLDAEASNAVQISVYLLVSGSRPGPDTAVLEPDGLHQRGTFQGADRHWQVSLPVPALTGPSRLVFSGPSDPPLVGVDALTGRPQVLQGNFGVLYDVTVQGGAGTLLAASARGGPYQGTLLVQDGGDDPRGAFPRRAPVLIGRGRALTEAAQPEAIWRVKADTLRLLFVAANGSNLPLALVFYPPGR